MDSRPPPRCTGYRYKLSEYAKIYQVSRKTISQWSFRGPYGYDLDDPERLYIQVGCQDRQPENYPWDAGKSWLRRYRALVRRKAKQK